jgi:phage terminase large subunit-like protein
MTDLLDTSAIHRWQRAPITFIEKVLRDPETGQPFQLFEAERQFFVHAWERKPDGRLVYPEQCWSAPKKTGKTGLNAAHVLTTTLLFGGRYGEAYTIANDLEQSLGRVFLAIKRICETSPYLRREAEITQRVIRFPQTGATITALGGDYASAAGAAPTISSFDELWGYTSERSRRLWDEMITTPTRKVSCRLVTSYAGFAGESNLLEDIFKRGMALPSIGEDLHAGNGLLFFWSHRPLAPWQTSEWLADMKRNLRTNQYLRMVENRWVTAESSFVDAAAWDNCVDERLAYVVNDPSLAVFVGVDASHKHDQTAIVATTFDHAAQQVRLVFHRVFQPHPNDPLDFEATIERTLLELRERFCIVKVLFDPWQMQSVAQRLRNHGLPIKELPQSPANLIAASQNLYELIQGQNLAVYPDEAMKLAISRTVALETARGWRITKEKTSHKIDVVVALAMACLAAVRNKSEDYYDYSGRWLQNENDGLDGRSHAAQTLNSFLEGMVARHGMPRSIYGPRQIDWLKRPTPRQSLFLKGWR